MLSYNKKKLFLGFFISVVTNNQSLACYMSVGTTYPLTLLSGEWFKREIIKYNLIIFIIFKFI